MKTAAIVTSPGGCGSEDGRGSGIGSGG